MSQRGITLCGQRDFADSFPWDHGDSVAFVAARPVKMPAGTSPSWTFDNACPEASTNLSLRSNGDLACIRNHA